MLQVFNIKKILFALLIALGSFSSACRHKVQDTMTNGEWLKELTTEAGIVSYQNDEPYYLNISVDSPYFSIVQAAVEWEVLDPSKSFDIDALLNRETVAYTLMNLIDRVHDASIDTVKDIQDTDYPKQVKAAIVSGLMKMDEHKRFYPKKAIEKEEAFSYLQEVIQIINNREFSESKTDTVLREDVQFTDETPAEVNFDEGYAIFASDSAVQSGNYLSYRQKFYRITSCENDNRHITAFIEEVMIEDVIDQLNLQGEAELQFNNAEISDGIGNVLQIGTNQEHGMSLMSDYRINHQFNMNGYTISLKGSTGSLYAEIYKQSAGGAKLYANVQLNNIRIQYLWDKDDQNMQAGYFKVTFDTSENLDIRNKRYKDLYGDFSKLQPHDFISSVQQLFQQKKDVVTDTINLCNFKIPLPNAPMITVSAGLNLHLYASGKAELSFVQNHVAGCEIRAGNMRMIYDHDKKAVASIKADTGISLGTNFALQAFHQKIMDVEVEAGAKAYFHTTAYLYNENGKAEAMEVEVAPDLINELADDHSDVDICTEMNAYWLCNLRLNSAETLAGRLGFGRNIPLLDEKSAPLFSKGKRTYQNWMEVDMYRCEEREKIEMPPQLEVRKRICLADYSLIMEVHQSKKIEVIGLPEGYTLDELLYTSKNTDVAEVKTDGTITAKNAGGTDVYIETKDHRHHIHCHILVVEKVKA